MGFSQQIRIKFLRLDGLLFGIQPDIYGTYIIGLVGAIPILLGDNIGTTITALLESVGQSKDAKRTALAHSVFNISEAVLFIWFVKPYAALSKRLKYLE